MLEINFLSLNTVICIKLILIGWNVLISTSKPTKLSGWGSWTGHAQHIAG